VKQARCRIRERGRDIGGYAALWADTARLKVGKGKRARFIDHYRKGGTPYTTPANCSVGSPASSSPWKGV
jgi:hypothetical protein